MSTVHLSSVGLLSFLSRPHPASIMWCLQQRADFTSCCQHGSHSVPGIFAASILFRIVAIAKCAGMALKLMSHQRDTVLNKVACAAPEGQTRHGYGEERPHLITQGDDILQKETVAEVALHVYQQQHLKKRVGGGG